MMNDMIEARSAQHLVPWHGENHVSLPRQRPNFLHLRVSHAGQCGAGLPVQFIERRHSSLCFCGDVPSSFDL